MSRVFAGVDLGGTSIATVIATSTGTIRGADRRPTPRRSPLDEVPATIAGSVHAAIVDAGCDPADVVGVGIGCPGQVDRTAGTFGNASTLPDWPETFPLAEEVGRHLSRPVVLDNDVRLAVAAEIASGAGRTFPSFLGVFLGTGVGAGLVLDGTLWLGRGNAGEFGHMVVDFEPDARRCSCGRTGCVQAYAGRAGMEAAARAAVEAGRSTALFDLMEFGERDRLTSSIWERSVRGGDPLTRELVDTAARALGAALGSTVNLIDVEAVILGGGLAVQLGEPFRESVAEAMAERVLASSVPPLRLTALGDLAGALGAAMLAADEA